MKVIKKIIKYEDFNYVEGDLELKISGNQYNDLKSKKEFSVDEILSAKFYVIKKFIFPEVPTAINKNRVFSFNLPKTISTYIEIDNELKSFNVDYDDMICDDTYVLEGGNVKINRYNSSRDGNLIFSTFRVKAYGLKKNIREEKEEVTVYQLFPNVIGEGKIKISPKKKYYDYGQEVEINAIPKKGYRFSHWEEDFESEPPVPNVNLKITKDYSFTAVFKELSEMELAAFEGDSSDFSSLKRMQSSTDSNKQWRSSGSSNFDYGREEKHSDYMFDGFGDVIASILGYMFLAYFLVFLISLLVVIFSWYIILILAIIFLIWFIPYLFNLPFNFKLLGKIFSFLILLFGLIGLINLFNTFNSFMVPSLLTNHDFNVEEIKKENETTDYVHVLEWKDYVDHDFKIKLQINSDQVNYEHLIKTSIPGVKNEKQYNDLLNRLYLESNESLFHVTKALDSIKINNKLEGLKFAEVVVSMVQSIPYYAIVQGSCNPYDYKDKKIRNLLSNNPCEGKVKHGLKTPAEFLKDIKGDCDTRTLFVFSVLKHYNFDVAIFGSDYYNHSLLGINSAEISDGVSIDLDNKKYYLWETTMKGIKAGDIHPEIRNTSYWNLNLK